MQEWYFRLQVSPPLVWPRDNGSGLILTKGGWWQLATLVRYSLSFVIPVEH